MKVKLIDESGKEIEITKFPANLLHAIAIAEAGQLEEPITLRGITGKEFRFKRLSPRRLLSLDSWLRTRRLRDFEASCPEDMPVARQAVMTAEILRSEVWDAEALQAWDNMTSAQLRVLWILARDYQPTIRPGDIEIEFGGPSLPVIKAAIEAASGYPTPAQIALGETDDDGTEDADESDPPRSGGDSTG